MIVSKWIKSYPQVRQVTRQTHPLKIGVERPLDDALIGQSVQNFLRNLLSIGNVDDLHCASINGIGKEQDRKILCLCITVNSTLADIYATPSFKIDRQ